MSPSPAPKVKPASPCGSVAGRIAVRLLVAVAPEEPVRRGEHVIDLQIDLVVLPLERRVDQVVVDGLAGGAARAGGVGFGNQLVQDVLGRRIEPVGRDDVARERQVRHRVVDDAIELGKIARAHLRRRHRRQVRRALVDVVALVVEEVERLVLDDRAADRAAVLVLAEVGLRPAGEIVEVVVLVELRVAQELEAAPVHGVGARLDLQVHDAAQRAAELGRVGAGLQLELVERVDAGKQDHRLQPGLVVVHAVEHVVVVARPLAVGRERRRRAPRQAAGAVDVRAGHAAHDAGHGSREVDEVTAVQRQRLDLLFRHRRAELGRGGLDQRRRAGHGHRFLDRADLELQVEAEVLIDAERRRRAR